MKQADVLEGTTKDGWRVTTVNQVGRGKGRVGTKVWVKVRCTHPGCWCSYVCKSRADQKILFSIATSMTARQFDQWWSGEPLDPQEEES